MIFLVDMFNFIFLHICPPVVLYDSKLWSLNIADGKVIQNLVCIFRQKLCIKVSLHKFQPTMSEGGEGGGGSNQDLRRRSRDREDPRGAVRQRKVQHQLPVLPRELNLMQAKDSYLASYEKKYHCFL